MIPLPLLLAMILAFGLGERGGPGPLPAREARHRMYELGLGVAALALAAWLLGAWLAWRTRRRGHPTLSLRRSLLWSLRAVDLAGLGIFAWALEGIDWPRIVGWNLGLRGSVLLDEGAVLLPFLVLQFLGWWGMYPAERVLRPSVRRLGRGRFLVLKARQGLGLVLPMALIYGLTRDLLDRQFPRLSESLWGQLAFMAAMGATVMALSPAFVRLAWPAKPLPPGPLRDRLERLARRFRFRCTDILVWDTGGVVVNAGVTGAVPWFRYVLLTDAMIENLELKEIEAVFGHEIGHIAHRHLAYFGFFLVGSMGLIMLLEAGLYVGLGTRVDGLVAAWFASPTASDLAEATIALGLLASYFLLVFGFLSRRFERQADLFGCRAVSCGRSDCPPHSDPNASPLTTLSLIHI